MKNFFIPLTSFSEVFSVSANHSSYTKNQFSIKTLLAFILLVSLLPVQSQAQGGVQGMSKLTIQLIFPNQQGGNITADGCVIAYKDNFLTGLGPEDSYKFTNVDENMAIPMGNTLLSVIGKPMIAPYDTIPLRIWQYRQLNYTLKFDGTNFPPNMEGVVKDNFLNVEKPVSLAGSTLVNYSITSDPASNAVNRFCVFLRPVSVLASGLVSLSATQKEAGVFLNWSMGSVPSGYKFEVMKSSTSDNYKSIATIYGITGKNNYEYIDKQTSRGVKYYKLKMVSTGGEIQYSRVIKISNNATDQSINIYPNPVRGNTIGLQLFNCSKDQYRLSIYNINGQEVFTTLLAVEEGNTTIPVQLNKKLERGTYHLRVSNSNQNFNKKLIID